MDFSRFSEKQLHWLIFAIAAFLVSTTSWIVGTLFFRLMGRLAERHSRYKLVYGLKEPGRFLFLAVTLLMLLPASPVSAGIQQSCERILDLSLIACVAWTLVTLIEAFEKNLDLKYRIDVADNLLARRIRTRLEVFHHILVAAIILLSLAIGLMTFPNVRSLGASMLASAGLAGIVVGMAARPALSNIIAGLQIAMTQPIRLEDVVIVEGEWGNIEEIYATYVVVRIWDLRRMILPLSYFLEHPFQNWTRTTSEILGSVFIYCDYSVPVEAVRQELTRILKSSPLWRGKVYGLQVTDLSEHTMQLRALMDSVDASKSFDLRCLVREQLISFLKSNFPEALPRARVELTAKPENKNAPIVEMRLP